MSEQIRLQKYLAQCGVASRRKAEEYILAGRVRVNGKIVNEVGTKVSAGDKVEFDGQEVATEVFGVVLLYKPLDVITTRSDTHDRATIMDLLPPEYQTYFPVGRLDQDTTGLVIMTNDGELADLLMHPRHEIDRVYIATVKYQFSAVAIGKIAQGFELEDGFVQGKVKLLASDSRSSRLEITLRVGRKHIVRRMCTHLGHPVTELVRIQHGPFNLSGMREGEYRVVGNNEYLKIRRKLMAQNSAEADNLD